VTDEPTVEQRLDRLEAAFTTLAWWLVQSPQPVIRQDEAAKLTAILRGEEPITMEMLP
jgi:hypothetical protein